MENARYLILKLFINNKSYLVLFKSLNNWKYFPQKPWQKWATAILNQAKHKQKKNISYVKCQQILPWASKAASLKEQMMQHSGKHTLVLISHLSPPPPAVPTLDLLCSNSSNQNQVLLHCSNRLCFSLFLSSDLIPQCVNWPPTSSPTNFMYRTIPQPSQEPASLCESGSSPQKKRSCSMTTNLLSAISFTR